MRECLCERERERKVKRWVERGREGKRGKRGERGGKGEERERSVCPFKK